MKQMGHGKRCREGKEMEVESRCFLRNLVVEGRNADYQKGKGV
jgi:hypothetical protein